MTIKDFTAKDYAAVYAAALSTILLIIKIIELWQSRFRIEADLWMIGDENEVYVYNHTKSTLTLKNFDLLFQKGSWPFRKSKQVETGYELAGPFRIPSNDFRKFKFVEENSFVTLPQYGKLYIKLYFAGRKKSVKLKLWPFK